MNTEPFVLLPPECGWTQRRDAMLECGGLKCPPGTFTDATALAPRLALARGTAIDLFSSLTLLCGSFAQRGRSVIIIQRDWKGLDFRRILGGSGIDDAVDAQRVGQFDHPLDFQSTLDAILAWFEPRLAAADEDSAFSFKVNAYRPPLTARDVTMMRGWLADICGRADFPRLEAAAPAWLRDAQTHRLKA